MDAIKRLSISYYKLTKVERVLAKKIIDKPTIIIDKSITDAAKVYGVSISSIQRLIKKIDYEGYSELRYALHNDLKNDEPASFEANTPINQIIDGYMDSMNALKKDMYYESAMYMKEQIMKANNLYLVGLGGSSYSAGYLEHMLFYEIRASICIHEQERFNYVDRILKKGDVIIIFSVSGAESILKDYDIDNFKNKGVKLILITMQEDTKVDAMLDYKVVLPRMPILVNDEQEKGIFIDNTSMFSMYTNILLFVLKSNA